MSKPIYSVVVPVYNGEKTIEELIFRLHNLFEQIGVAYEIIFVDDCSKDNSWDILEKVSARKNMISAIKLAGNFGQHNATICGMKYVRGMYVITMDDDLQHSPEDITNLIQMMNRSKAKAVIAKLSMKKHKCYRNLASSLIRRLAELTINKPKGLYLSSFRLIERQVVEKMLSFNYPNPYIPALIFRVTKEVVNVEIDHRDRKYGVSNYTLKKMMKLAVQLVMNSTFFDNMKRSSGLSYKVEKILCRDKHLQEMSALSDEHP